MTELSATDQLAGDLLAQARTLQRSSPGMSFDEAWNRSKAAHDSLLPVEEVPRE